MKKEKTVKKSSSLKRRTFKSLLTGFALSILTSPLMAFASDPAAPPSSGSGTTIVSSTVQTVITLISDGCILAGGVMCVWNLIVIGTNLKDHNGPGIQQGIWGVIGGGIIITAGSLFLTLI